MYIASASSVVKFHDASTKELIYTHQPTHRIEGPCRSLSWSKDGNWLAVVPHSGCTEIVTLKNQFKLLHTVQDVAEPSCASFQNLTKRTIAVGTRHGQVLLYDIKSRSVKARYPRTCSAITHVGFTARDTHCYVACANGDVLLFNNVAKNLSTTWRVPRARSVTALRAHAQKRNYLVAGSNEGVVAVWDVNSKKVKFQTDAHAGPVAAVVFSPINTALVVSAGQDRVVRVFDVDSNCRIRSIGVDNNVTALDFTEDATYMTMGSQNGKLHLYDSRNFQTPVWSIEAHKSAVRHVVYQCSSDDQTGSGSLANVTSDSTNRSSKSNEEVAAVKRNVSDFFDLVVSVPTSVSEGFNVGNQQHQQQQQQQQDVSVADSGGDSFLKALGLDHAANHSGASMVSIKEEEGAEIDGGRKSIPKQNRLSSTAYTPNPVKNIHNKLGLYDSRHAVRTTSTPTHRADGLSPIGVATTDDCVPTSMAQVRDAIKEANEEVHKSLQEMETKMTYLVMNHAHQIRRMILDLHMASLKEFIKMEDYFNVIRDEINPEPVSSRENYLIEENFGLKKQIGELEQQLAKLKLAKEENGNE